MSNQSFRFTNDQRKALTISALSRFPDNQVSKFLDLCQDDIGDWQERWNVDKPLNSSPENRRRLLNLSKKLHETRAAF